MSEQELEQTQEAEESQDSGTDTGDMSGDTDATEDADERGVPWKNRAMEAQRKFSKLEKELAAMRSEMSKSAKSDAAPVKASAGSDDEYADLAKELEADGFEPKAIKYIVKVARKEGEKYGANISRQVEPVLRMAREHNIDKLKADPKLGKYVTLFESELNDALDSIPDKSVASSMDAIRFALGKVMTDNADRLSGAPAKRPAGKLMEDDAPNSGGSSGSMVSDEVRTFMREHPELDDPKAVKEIIAAKKKMEQAKATKKAR